MSAVEHFCSVNVFFSTSAWVIPCFLTFSLIFGLRLLIVKDYTDIFFIQEIIAILCEALALFALWKTNAANDNLEVSEEKLSTDIPAKKNSSQKMENPVKPTKKKNRRKRYSFEHLPALTTVTQDADSTNHPPIGDTQPEPATSEEEAVNATPTPDAQPKTPTVMKDANNNTVATKKSTRPVPDYIKEVTKRTYIVGLNPVGGKKKKKKSKKDSATYSYPVYVTNVVSASGDLVTSFPSYDSLVKTPVPLTSQLDESERKVLKPVDQQTLLNTQIRKNKTKNPSDDVENKRKLRRQAIPKNSSFYVRKLPYPPMCLYNHLSSYKLNEKDLWIRDFPTLSDTFSNRIIGQEDVASQLQSSDDPTTLHRTCCRCGGSYSIRNSVDYFSKEDDFCSFHPGRFNKTTGRYSCCDGTSATTGCRIHQYHVSTETDLRHACFKSTRPPSKNKPASIKIYALDCEMVYTTIGMSVARVSLVKLDGTVVLDETVVPDYPVLDYNTEFSGVSSKDYAVECRTYDLYTIQKILLDMIDEDTILIGHALENDLRVLHLVHKNIVDTQAVFAGNRGRRRRLKDIAWEYLGMEIQTSLNGHCGVEDARACAELMLATLLAPQKMQPLFPPKPEVYPSLLSTYHHCEDCVPYRDMYAGQRLYFPR